MLKIKRSELVRKLDKLENNYGDGNLPITKGILIEQVHNKLLFLATKLDVFAQTFIDLGEESKLEGRICVDGATFISIIKKMEAEDIQIDVKENKILIASDNTKVEMQLMDQSLFPQLPTISQGTPLLIDLKYFLVGVKHTGFSASVDDQRPAALRCIRFVVEENNVSLISTDGFRVSKFKFKSDSPVPHKIGVNIQPELLNKILERQTVSDGSKCAVNITDTHLVLQFVDAIYIVKLVDGDYLNVDAMLAANNNILMTVNRKDLLSAIDLLNQIRSSQLSIVNFCINDDKVLLRNEVESNSIDKFLKVDHEGEDVKISFNLKYMREVLSVMTSENVIFRIKSRLELVTVEPVGYEYKHAILPVAVNK